MSEEPVEGQMGTNRRVYALLISVPTSPAFGTDEILDLPPAIRRIEDMLDARFPNPRPVRKTLEGPAATQHRVTIELEDLLQQAASGDLVFILFAGHGIAAVPSHNYQAWALHDAELSDRQLAKYLEPLQAPTDIVIVSDCCYGGGIARPGQYQPGDRAQSLDWVWIFMRVLLRWPLRALARLHRLSDLVRGWRPSALFGSHGDTVGNDKKRIVCISAASWFLDTDLSAIPRLLHTLADIVPKDANAPKDVSNGDLADFFENHAVPGADFQVYARPNALMCTPLLPRLTNSHAHEGSEPMTKPDPDPKSTTEAAAAEDPNLTRYAFINYGDDTLKLEIDLDNTGVLLKVIKPVVAQGEAEPTASLVSENGKQYLVLDAGMVAGFTSLAAVTPKLGPMRLHVITLRGKNPPMPPPPQLARYAKTPDFDARFRELLGASSASAV